MPFWLHPQPKPSPSRSLPSFSATFLRIPWRSSDKVVPTPSHWWFGWVWYSSGRSSAFILYFQAVVFIFCFHFTSFRFIFLKIPEFAQWCCLSFWSKCLIDQLILLTLLIWPPMSWYHFLSSQSLLYCFYSPFPIQSF